MRKLILLVLLLLFIFVSGCTNLLNENNHQSHGAIHKREAHMGLFYNDTDSVKFEGYIIEKTENQILVMNKITKKDLENKTTEELIEQARSDKAAIYSYYFVDERKINELKVGQKVSVWSKKKQPQMESDPPQRGLLAVDIMED